MPALYLRSVNAVRSAAVLRTVFCGRPVFRVFCVLCTTRLPCFLCVGVFCGSLFRIDSSRFAVLCSRAAAL